MMLDMLLGRAHYVNWKSETKALTFFLFPWISLKGSKARQTDEAFFTISIISFPFVLLGSVVWLLNCFILISFFNVATMMNIAVVDGFLLWSGALPFAFFFSEEKNENSKREKRKKMMRMAFERWNNMWSRNKQKAIQWNLIKQKVFFVASGAATVLARVKIPTISDIKRIAPDGFSRPSFTTRR